MVGVRGIGLLASALIAVAATSDRKLASLRQQVGVLLEKDGLADPTLAASLGEIVALAPEDHDALGLLALHRTHHSDWEGALGLMTRLQKVKALPTSTRAFAARFAKSLENIQEGRIRAAIAPLRWVLNVGHLLPESKKLPLHYSFEEEASGLLQGLDSSLQQDEVAQGTPTNRDVASYVPGLLARPLWSGKLLDLAVALEGAVDDISREVLALRKDDSRWAAVGRSTDLHDSGLVTRGAWKDLTVFKHNRFDASNCEQLPLLCALIQEHPDVTTNPYAMVLIDELSPGTEVREHHGVFNGHLTYHLPLSLPEEDVCGLSVAGSQTTWRSREALVFDDSFEHSVWHRGTAGVSAPRLVLLLRAWHPELSLEERRTTLGVVAADPNSGIQDEDRKRALKELQAESTKKRWRQQLDRIDAWAKRNFQEEM